MNSLMKSFDVFLMIFFGGFAIFDLYNGNIEWFVFNLLLFAFITAKFMYPTQT